MVNDQDKLMVLRRLTRPTLEQPTRPKSKEDEELIRLALHHSPFFTCLDEEQVERFVKAAQLKSYAPGQVVILEGYLDDDTKDGDGDTIDTMGLLKRLLKVETAEENPSVAIIKEAVSTIKEGAADEAMLEGEVSDFVDDSEGDDEFLLDENDEAYASLDSTSSTTSSDDHGDDSLDPASSATSLSTVEVDQDDSDNQEDDDESLRMSGIASYVYTVRSGSVDIWHGAANVASIGKGVMFGEGGFLFHRQHSATALASGSGELECWVVPSKIFRNYVLPSDNMVRMFAKHATKVDADGNPYMTMDDFVQSCLDREVVDGVDPAVRGKMAKTYNILRRTDGIQKIDLANFCLFHLLMSRPDPEVDIAFLLMDQARRGAITLNDIARFLDSQDKDHGFNLDCDFIRRHFGNDGSRTIRPHHFSQFLIDFQREMGRQAFLNGVELHGTPEGHLMPTEFVQVLKTACGWRLPAGIAERLENIYCNPPMEAAEAAAVMAVKAENLKGSSDAEITKSTTASILANIERRSKHLGDRAFAYSDFLAFQEVLQQLPGICNLIHGACAIKQGPVSPDDFKVASRVIGLDGKLSRRQVDIVFQIFDLDHDGFISGEDTASVMGVDFVYKLQATAGREGKLTFAPPPIFEEDVEMDSTSLEDDEAQPSLLAHISDYAYRFAVGGAAGIIGAAAGVLTNPADLVKTRMQLQRIRPDGVRMYNNTWDCFVRAFRGEGVAGLYRGTLPYLAGIAPQRAVQLTMYHQLCEAFTYHDEETGIGYVPLPLEALSGGTAGACQVLFSNPMEIAKIELQTEGETARMMRARRRPVPPPLSFANVAKEIRVLGLYTGAASSLWRDVPYSAMFFPLYTKTRASLLELEGYSPDPIRDAFTAAILAAIPAAILTTPADVIKTRLQHGPREGGIVYKGVRHCSLQMYKHEGFQAFFKGAGLRSIRCAPQMGLTMAAYEKLSSMLDTRKFTSPSRTNNDSNDYRRTYPMRGYGNKAEDIDDLLDHMGMTSAPSDRKTK